jgi:hypothetical protein
MQQLIDKLLEAGVFRRMNRLQRKITLTAGSRDVIPFINRNRLYEIADLNLRKRF